MQSQATNKTSNSPRSAEWKAQRAKGLHWCGRCKTWQERSGFYADKNKADGCGRPCIACHKVAAAKREEEKKRLRELEVPPGYRKCKRCDGIKPLVDFRQRVVKCGRQKGQTQIDTRCIPCARLADREDRKKNPGKYHARDFRRYHKPGSTRKQEAEIYRTNNPDKVRESRKRTYARHKNRRAAASAAWRKANLAYVKAYLSAWRKANPEICKDLANRHRARVLAAEGEYSQKEWRQLLRKYKNRCLKCGIAAKETPEGYLAADHIVPLKRGGTNSIANIQPLCTSCNSSKGARHSADYRPNPFTGNGQLTLLSFAI